MWFPGLQAMHDTGMSMTNISIVDISSVTMASSFSQFN
jgi:hypothetical protein